MNQGDEFDPLVNGAFQFPAYLADATSYSVTVATQPSSPAQVCTVQNGVGTVASADVTSVSVNCLNIGQFVYVVNSTDNSNGTVSAFAINPTTGGLTAIGSNVPAHTKPTAIAIDYTVPFVPIVYVANATSADLTELDFKTVGGSGGAAGALNNLGNTDTPGQGPASITIAPSGSFLFSGGYGSAATGTLYGFVLDKNGDPPQDLPAASITTPGPVLGITIDPTNHWLFATTSSANSLMVYSIAADATLTPVTTAPFPTGNDPHGVVVWPNSTAKGGFVYAANRLDSTISAFTFDGTSGKLQPAGTYPTGQGPSGIAIDPTGSYLYTANSGDGTLSTLTINRSTGALAALGAAVASGNLHPTLSSNPGPVDVKVDPSGQFVYCVNSTDGSLSVFTAKSGALTLSNTYATGAGAAAVAVY
jgi:6-phosphogluconolactonase (cycloisomerase 2 family)